jgi:hypothetical protein
VALVGLDPGGRYRMTNLANSHEVELPGAELLDGWEIRLDGVHAGLWHWMRLE